MKRKNLLNRLKELNIKDAIADKFASVDGTPAILLRWNGKEEYYTGFGSDQLGESQPEYENWLQKVFGKK